MSKASVWSTALVDSRTWQNDIWQDGLCSAESSHADFGVASVRYTAKVGSITISPCIVLIVFVYEQLGTSHKDRQSCRDDLPETHRHPSRQGLFLSLRPLYGLNFSQLQESMDVCLATLVKYVDSRKENERSLELAIATRALKDIIFRLNIRFGELANLAY